MTRERGERARDGIADGIEDLVIILFAAFHPRAQKHGVISCGNICAAAPRRYAHRRPDVFLRDDARARFTMTCCLDSFLSAA